MRDNHGPRRSRLGRSAADVFGLVEETQKKKWRLVAIPPHAGSFANKRDLPQEWAGLVDDELSKVVGVPGAAFCHKNRFIAVFETRKAALDAMEKWQLLHRVGSPG